MSMSTSVMEAKQAINGHVLSKDLHTCSLAQPYFICYFRLYWFYFPVCSIKIAAIYRFPSAFILRGSGLSPAPQTVRSSMAVNALDSFIKTIGCSDFFNQGLLKVKEVSSIETLMMQPAWKMARTAGVNNKSITSTQESVKDQCIISQNSHLILDFRTPKPALHYTSANRMLDHDKSNATAVLTREEMTVITTTCSIKPPIPEALNEGVQVPVKAPPLSQSQAYQRVDNKEVNSESCAKKKKKAKQHTDSSDVNSKVSDFHARGKLQSLTVPDLKHFLASRKVKVGGKKDELIQRVLEILG